MAAFLGLSEHYERFSASGIAQGSVALLAVLIAAHLGLMPLLTRKPRFNPKDKVRSKFCQTLLLGHGELTLRESDQRQHCYIGGGSEGLGLSLACQLAERGAHVTIISRSQSKLDKALELVKVSPRRSSVLRGFWLTRPRVVFI